MTQRARSLGIICVLKKDAEGKLAFATIDCKAHFATPPQIKMQECVMLADFNSSAIVAVRNLDRARAFYEDALGLKLSETGGDRVIMQFKTGATKLVIFHSYEPTNQRVPSVVWSVGDELDDIIASLASKQVIFHCQDHGVADGSKQGSSGFKMVSFKDPDGNILQLNNL